MESRMVLDNLPRNFTPGGVVSGYLEISIRIPVYINSITMHYLGWILCKCEKNDTDTNDTTSTMTTATLQGEQILNYVQPIYSGASCLMPLGCNRYRFEYTLPKDLPPSFEGQFGYTRYRVRAIISTNLAEDVIEEEIKVVGLMDGANKVPDGSEPFHITDTMAVGFWCCHTGRIKVKVLGPLRSFVPGQTVPFQIQVKNDTKVQIRKTTIELYKNVQLRDTCKTIIPKCSKVVIARCTDNTTVPRQTMVKINSFMQIPITEPTTCQPNTQFRVNYFVQVHCFTGCCHWPVFGSAIAYIGTVPLTCQGKPRQ